jgi:sulfide:quinone oxidoreductase
MHVLKCTTGLNFCCFRAAQEVVRTRDIDVQLATHLVEVRGDKREAVFEILGKDCQPVDHKVIKYDMLHVTPPQGPLDVVAESAIANADGWVDVDPEVSLVFAV